MSQSSHYAVTEMGRFECEACGNNYTRAFDLRRHQMQKHTELFKQEKDEIKSESESENDEDDQASEVSDSRDDASDVGDDDDGGSEADDSQVDESEEDDESGESSDEDIYNLWKYLVSCARKDPNIIEKYNDVKEKLSNETNDEEKEETDKDALRVVRPKMFQHICKHYANLLKLWHFAKRDSTHKKIMKIKQNLMEDDELDPVEAIEHAVKKCKYSIHKASGLLYVDISEDLPVTKFDSDMDTDDVNDTDNEQES